MRALISLSFLISLILISMPGFGQAPDQLNSGKSQTQSRQLKSKGKPLVTKGKAPHRKLFGKNKSDKVPPGYAYDNRETAPKKLTDNPNAKQILPKNQQKRLATKKKKKLFKN